MRLLPGIRMVERFARSPMAGRGSCTADGQFLLVSKPDGIWKVPLEPKGNDPGALLFANAHQGAVSPDGKWIAMHLQSGPYAGVESTGEKLVIRSMTGGTDAKFPEMSPRVFFDWLPDSSGIIFSTQEDGRTNLWIRRLDGGSKKQVTYFTSDHIFSLSVSRAGRVAMGRGRQT